ncbi:hypothetical protein HV454_16560 [Bacillus sporothermodurans]|nr:hypothetical protein [Heyndrickxia sporothermodurans]MBL5772998.1 hypothetical protein [Heyndrickxia sporothermodurans]MBL5776466.1 hypothetical protein [Heyndrickxia sporothermodurans]MBL5779964.1 hypothetical protein [Heyndrickxia sporothermodurans]MBL5787107.1 hypothetical protein [Heyndrickxia sporothermodurans]
MNYIEKNTPHIRGGFIHIPFIPEQTINNNAPSLSLDVIVRGLEIAIITSANEGKDIREVGGTIH